MRTSADFKVYFHDLDQPDLMVQGGKKGARRKRMRPETLLVQWSQKIDKDTWQLWHVYLMGRYVHAQSSTWISMNCFDRLTWDENTPEWVRELVGKFMPMYRPVVEESQLTR